MSKRKVKRSRLLNNLSLEEKLRVIKAYSEQPSYQELADKFHCSSKQIRNILLESNNISSEKVSVQTHNKREQELHQMNLKNIALIDKVVKEWYFRAKHYPTTGQITYKMIREKVQQAREALNIANFIPTNSWMTSFRNDCNKLVANKKMHETMLLPLNIKTIANEVLQQQNGNNDLVYGKYDSKDNKELIIPSSAPQFSMLPRVQIIVIKPKPNNTKIDPHHAGDAKLDDILAAQGQAKPNGTNNEISKNCGTDMLRKDCQPMTVLQSSDDVLRYLKPLEDFALLSENYRAIGLITQLEAHFCKPSEKKVA